ncbi:chloramphenicol hydrolase [Novosphingobium sp.]|uniref:chloramphenicol hydrolase n=1 Tax=Novosphingobium sp. TaxID=1874826 RepID=UPI002735F845|nr:chloramphenicol hydrolase [Novosphingobium sp.]MDP3905719.1 chloramphenicol hydrolase [Novosphingobium sp.]
MPLNPQVEALLAMFAALPPVDFTTLTAPALRATNDTPLAFGEPPAVAQVQDLLLDLPGRTLPARLYVPEGAAQPAAPLVVYYHGGGWVIGTLETHDATCRALARASGAAVLSVGYRLAPEHAYPAPVDDCYDALVWAAANAGALGCDPAQLAVAGDSAGGNLAAAVAILARDRSGPALRHQLLIYPVTDDDFTLPSYAENGGGEYFLGTEMMRWFWDQYLGRAADAPLARIAGTPDLASLPPATVITAEFDPLRDEGMAYAARLAGAGVPVDAATAPGMIHGFFSMFQPVPDALPWIDRAGANLRSGWCAA